MSNGCCSSTAAAAAAHGRTAVSASKKLAGGNASGHVEIRGRLAVHGSVQGRKRFLLPPGRLAGAQAPRPPRPVPPPRPDARTFPEAG